MAATVENFVQIKHRQWQKALPEVVELCQTAANAAWTMVLDSKQAYEVTIVLADDAFMQDLNSTYRGQDKPTNVLSFPGEEGGLPDPLGNEDVASLGDIIIAFETTQKEASENLADHLSHLVIHGCLHLLGYDHEEDGEADEMEALETKILAGLGVANPYDEITN